MPRDDVRAEIERILRESLDPDYLEVEDDSDRHAGHAGATSGGGHFRVAIVSERFRGASRLEQHRMVHAALADLFGDRIHALGLRTSEPRTEGRIEDDGS